MNSRTSWSLSLLICLLDHWWTLFPLCRKAYWVTTQTVRETRTTSWSSTCSRLTPSTTCSTWRITTNLARANLGAASWLQQTQTHLTISKLHYLPSTTTTSNTGRKMLTNSNACLIWICHWKITISYNTWERRTCKFSGMGIKLSCEIQKWSYIKTFQDIFQIQLLSRHVNC